MEGNTILFLHGLEAGINGTKGLFLRKHFKNCICPDLEASLFKINKRNSILRLVLINPMFILLLLISTVLFYHLVKILGIIKGIITGIIFFVGTIFSLKKYFMRKAVRRAVDNNVNLAFSEIKKYNPKVIIGSSWGGGIALKLIERGMWNGHTIVLAPAYYAMNKVFYNDQPDKIKSFQLKNIEGYKGKIIVYHSVNDEVIRYSDSQYLCEVGVISPNNFELRSLINDDHSLNSLIGQPECKLLKDINELLKS